MKKNEMKNLKQGTSYSPLHVGEVAVATFVSINMNLMFIFILGYFSQFNPADLIPMAVLLLGDITLFLILKNMIKLCLGTIIFSEKGVIFTSLFGKKTIIKWSECEQIRLEYYDTGYAQNSFFILCFVSKEKEYKKMHELTKVPNPKDGIIVMNYIECAWDDILRYAPQKLIKKAYSKRYIVERGLRSIVNSRTTLITSKLIRNIGETTSSHRNYADGVRTYPLFELGMLLATNICFWLVIAIAVNNSIIRALMCILIIVAVIALVYILRHRIVIYNDSISIRSGLRSEKRRGHVYFNELTYKMVLHGRYVLLSKCDRTVNILIPAGNRYANKILLRIRNENRKN